MKIKYISRLISSNFNNKFNKIIFKIYLLTLILINNTKIKFHKKSKINSRYNKNNKSILNKTILVKY